METLIVVKSGSKLLSMRLPSRRALRIARILGFLFILIGPIGITAVERPGRLTGERPEARGLVESKLPSAYAAHRNPAVDRLLPEGYGGTRYYDNLGKVSRRGDALGVAFLRAGAIGLLRTLDTDSWSAATELHERAHLLYQALSSDFARLLAKLPEPAADEYAAENPHEHVAEMAATAWEIVTDLDNACVDGTPLGRLRDAERRVPGTAGFVGWYLRDSSLGPSQQRAELAKLADELSAPQGEEWNAIWSDVEARRQRNGTFKPWEPMSIRQLLEADQSAYFASSRFIDPLAAIAMAPSIMLLKLLGA